MLEIKDLIVEVDGKKIIDGLSLTINKGEKHAIMGPNGSGKSTLSKVIAGFPDYEVVSGDVIYNGKSLLDMDVDERSLAGIFMAFQYPVEIPGVNNEEFLRMAYNAKLKKLGKEEIDALDFSELIQDKLAALGMNEKFLERNVNHGFSGGEKKRNEILQLLVLEPEFVILDETDSGLDIDALRIVAQNVNNYRREDRSMLIITHYQRLLDYIEPDVVHVLADGKIVKSGDKSLALELEEKGYDWVEAGV